MRKRRALRPRSLKPVSSLSGYSYRSPRRPNSSDDDSILNGNPLKLAGRYTGTPQSLAMRLPSHAVSPPVSFDADRGATPRELEGMPATGMLTPSSPPTSASAATLPNDEPISDGLNLLKLSFGQILGSSKSLRRSISLGSNSSSSLCRPLRNNSLGRIFSSPGFTTMGVFWMVSLVPLMRGTGISSPVDLPPGGTSGGGGGGVMGFGRFGFSGFGQMSGSSSGDSTFGFVGFCSCGERGVLGLSVVDDVDGARVVGAGVAGRGVLGSSVVDDVSPLSGGRPRTIARPGLPWRSRGIGPAGGASSPSPFLSPAFIKSQSIQPLSQSKNATHPCLKASM